MSGVEVVNIPALSIFVPSESKADDFLVFGRPDVGQKELEALTAVIRSGWLSTGKVAEQFETEFAAFLGRGYPVAVSSCTDALIISLMACGVGHGDEVITTPLTFAATVNAILAVGAKPVFIDVDDMGQINPDLISKSVTPNTKAIIPVHYTGDSPDMDRLLDVAHIHGLRVIEDAAHGFGGSFHGKALGTLGDFGCFSFYPTKNITAGEGGMIVARSREMADIARTIAMNGLSANAHKRYGSGPVRNYEVSRPGRKANLSDIHAAIGLTQLRRWSIDLRRNRAAIWTVYEEAFGVKSKEHARHLFTIHHKNRDGLREFLHSKGIGTGIHFKPLHLEPAFASLGYAPGSFPIAEKIGSTTLSLPVSSTMSVEDADRVVSAVNQYGEGK